MFLACDSRLLPLCCALVLAGSAAMHFSRQRRNTLPLPPGPTPSPLLGNVADVPKEKEWLAYTKMAEEYGPIVHLRILTQHIVVLNTLEAAVDLLDKRGKIYSDRPQTTMLHELMGWTWATGLMPYSEYWRAHRKILHHFLHAGAARQYRDMQLRNSRILMRELLDTPQDFWHHVHRFGARNIMSSVYGIDVASKDDPWMQLADDAMNCITGAGLPGSYAVDWFPILKYVPEWLPGMGFKQQAREWRKLSLQLPNAPFEKVKSELATGAQKMPSMTSELLEHGIGNRDVPEEVIRNSMGVMYLAGVDTTTATLHSFMLMMVLHQDKQRAAQEELGRVVGYDRLPDYGDMESLPYVQALVLEVYRLFPVAPLNLPRRVMSDDEYHGIRIPEGSTVLTNIWAILRDKETYGPDAHSFAPERFLCEGKLDLESTKDPRDITFGFGRRVCSGKHVAEASVWIVVATVLACFDIAPCNDEALPKVEMRSGLVAGLAPFECQITPRSGAAKHLAQISAVE